MAHKIILPSGNKIEVEASKQNLINYELVYSVDTEELAIKLNNEVVYIGKVVNWDDIENKPDLLDLDYLEDELNNLKIELENYIDDELEEVRQDITDLELNKQDKLIAGDNITLSNNTISANVYKPDEVTIVVNDEDKLKVSERLEIDGGFL